MNVLLINGSPHKKGCTYTALSEVAGQLEKNGIGSNIVHIGSKPIRGCIACGACRGGAPLFCNKIQCLAAFRCGTVDATCEPYLFLLCRRD